MVARKVLVCAIVGNPVHRTAICHALTSFYQVRAYEDPVQAIAEMSATPPAAILVDEEVEVWGGCGNDLQNPQTCYSGRNASDLHDSHQRLHCFS